jgi:hypothetical protein
MRCVILRVRGDEHGILRDCDYAVVEAEGLAEVIEARVGLVRSLKASQGVLRVTFSDVVDPVFVGEDAIGELFGAEALKKAGEEGIVVAETEGIPGSLGSPMSACVLDAGAGDAYWVAVPRHCEFEVYTQRVYADDLAAIRGETPARR